MTGIDQIARDLEELRRDHALLRKTLVRQGTVQLVDPVACTVIVQFAGEDASGAPATSLPVPWFQRGSEHRPPAVGDHALLIDPSLGHGAGLAITGWPSTAKPPPPERGLTNKNVLYKGDAPALIIADEIELGIGTLESPLEPPALASLVDAEFARVWSVLTDPTVVPVLPAGTDGGEVGLTTLLSAAAVEAELVQSVAASQVKLK